MANLSAGSRCCSLKTSGRLNSLQPISNRRMVVAVRAVPEASSTSESTAPPAPGGSCKKCGVDLSKQPWGCDGDGHQIGGIAAVPFMTWWPIKVYRPCPAANEAGIEYTRKGQEINEVLFGGVSLGSAGQKTMRKSGQSDK